jgi:nucleoid-associated protein EbfC
MFGGLGNLAGMFKQAKAMQENVRKMQEALAQQRFEGDAGAGMVRAQVNGRGELISVKIDPQAVGDVELLEDLVVSAVTAASRKAHEGMKEEMGKLTGGLDLSAFSQLLGQQGP